MKATRTKELIYIRVDTFEMIVFYYLDPNKNNNFDLQLCLDFRVTKKNFQASGAHMIRSEYGNINLCRLVM